MMAALTGETLGVNDPAGSVGGVVFGVSVAVFQSAVTSAMAGVRVVNSSTLALSAARRRGTQGRGC